MSASSRLPPPRLIAAAPEMLEALRECRNVMLLEHALKPDYGWRDFVQKHIDPVLLKIDGGVK